MSLSARFALIQNHCSRLIEFVQRSQTVKLPGNWPDMNPCAIEDQGGPPRAMERQGQPERTAREEHLINANPGLVWQSSQSIDLTTLPQVVAVVRAALGEMFHHGFFNWTLVFGSSLLCACVLRNDQCITRKVGLSKKPLGKSQQVKRNALTDPRVGEKRLE